MWVDSPSSSSQGLAFLWVAILYVFSMPSYIGPPSINQQLGGGRNEKFNFYRLTRREGQLIACWQWRLSGWQGEEKAIDPRLVHRSTVLLLLLILCEEFASQCFSTSPGSLWEDDIKKNRATKTLLLSSGKIPQSECLVFFTRFFESINKSILKF